MSQQRSSVPDKLKSHHPVMRFSGMAFQMAAAIGLGTWAGMKLDEHWAMEKPLLTAAGALLGTIVAIYQVVKSLKS